MDFKLWIARLRLATAIGLIILGWLAFAGVLLGIESCVIAIKGWAWRAIE